MLQAEILQICILVKTDELLVMHQLFYTDRVLLTKQVCKWVSATEEFPEYIFWVAECELFMEMLSIVEMAP